MNKKSAKQVKFDADLIRRYNKSGPRYTSYPTAVQFQDDFGVTEYQQQVNKSLKKSSAAPAPLSLYFHLPFCNTVCFYCACNKIVTKNKERAAPYLHLLHHDQKHHLSFYN